MAIMLLNMLIHFYCEIQFILVAMLVKRTSNLVSKHEVFWNS